MGSRLIVRQSLAVFFHYYDVQRPHQSLDGKTPSQEVN
ncbi:integrase core domain-containing protein [Haloferax sp. KTX1]